MKFSGLSGLGLCGLNFLIPQLFAEQKSPVGYWWFLAIAIQTTNWQRWVVWTHFCNLSLKLLLLIRTKISSISDFQVWLMNNLFICRYPPGHGDVYHSLSNSGKLDALLSQVDIRNQFVCCFNWWLMSVSLCMCVHFFLFLVILQGKEYVWAIVDLSILTPLFISGHICYR